VKRRRIFVEMPNNLVPSPRPLLILLDEAFDYVAECVLRPANAPSLLRRRVAAQADPGMQLAGDLSCPGKFLQSSVGDVSWLAADRLRSIRSSVRTAARSINWSKLTLGRNQIIAK
jgi:hypothetical protein